MCTWVYSFLHGLVLNIFYALFIVAISHMLQTLLHTRFRFSLGAESFKMSPVDRIFVRMGAEDHIMAGQSATIHNSAHKWTTRYRTFVSFVCEVVFWPIYRIWLFKWLKGKATKKWIFIKLPNGIKQMPADWPNPAPVQYLPIVPQPCWAYYLSHTFRFFHL